MTKKRTLRRTLAVGLLLLSTLSAAARGKESEIDLAGRWGLRLDRDDRGIAEGWCREPMPDAVDLPGTLPGAGKGDPVAPETRWTGGINDRSWFTSPRYAAYRQPGNVKVPFWLQPETVYVGPAWYGRDVEVPAGWVGKRSVLRLERPHGQTRVWVDGRLIGVQDSLGVPHEYDLGNLPPGRHRLTIRMDNRVLIDVGENAHSVSDHTQGNWNGIVGAIELRARGSRWIDDLEAFPDVADRRVRVEGRVAGADGTVKLRVVGPGVDARAAVLSSGGGFSIEIPLGDRALPWDEFHPNLYRLTACLGEERRSTTFGLREIATEGTEFRLNGRPLFLRGTLDCAAYPRTGHPPADVASWRRVVRIAKSYGLNHIRFHSWCPPEAAFVAADELGFYYQVEVSAWSDVGDDPALDRWIYQEADRMLREYGNHPSFLLMPYGNEPLGKNSDAFLAGFVAHYRARDPRRLYTSGSGWPQLAANQFHVTPLPRIQGWGQGLASRINARPPETRTDYRDFVRTHAVPVISHEIGEWCAYPDFSEIPRYTGYLKPRNFEIFRDFLEASGQGSEAKGFVRASGALQVLCDKEDIESALRTPGFGGFQLLGLTDFPGQGTAPVGVLDALWEPKGYVGPRAFRRFCGPTVPLARLDRRVFTRDETMVADLGVAHFGEAPLRGVRPRWRLVGDDRRTYASGELPSRDVALGSGQEIARVAIPLHNLPSPARYRLAFGFEGLPYENDWDVWVYSPQGDEAVPPGIQTTSSVEAAIALAEGGGTVLLNARKQDLRGDERGPVAVGFSTIFWNTAWSGDQPPHTMGVLVDPKGPLFRDFPTDFCSNWQWWYLVHDAGGMVLDGLPRGLRPTVGLIDDWNSARRLGLVFEGRMGRGRILVCSTRLEDTSDPVKRAFRRSLLRYLGSKEFRPKTAIPPDELRSVFAPSAVR